MNRTQTLPVKSPQSQGGACCHRKGQSEGLSRAEGGWEGWEITDGCREGVTLVPGGNAQAGLEAKFRAVGGKPVGYTEAQAGSDESGGAQVDEPVLARPCTASHGVGPANRQVCELDRAQVAPGVGTMCLTAG